jgi:hypothetical protein
MCTEPTHTQGFPNIVKAEECHEQPAGKQTGLISDEHNVLHVTTDP